MDINASGVWANKGICLMRQNQYSEALNCLDMAIDIDPNNEGFYNLQDDCFRELNKLEHQKSEFQRDIEKKMKYIFDFFKYKLDCLPSSLDKTDDNPYAYAHFTTGFNDWYILLGNQLETDQYYFIAVECGMDGNKVDYFLSSELAMMGAQIDVNFKPTRIKDIYKDFDSTSVIKLLDEGFGYVRGNKY